MVVQLALEKFVMCIEIIDNIDCCPIYKQVNFVVHLTTP